MIALSIRQPWAWFILCDHPKAKDVENRQWSAAYLATQQRLCPPGRDILIHASKGMTRQEFEDACKFALDCGCTMLPQFDTVLRGGYVGIVRVERYCKSSKSRWFVPGSVGLNLTCPYPIPFEPAIGRLGFWKAEEPYSGGDDMKEWK